MLIESDDIMAMSTQVFLRGLCMQNTAVVLAVLKDWRPNSHKKISKKNEVSALTELDSSWGLITVRDSTEPDFPDEEEHA